MKNLWEKSERNARYLLSERLCDSLCLKTWKLETVAARWEFLEKMYGKLANVSGEVLPPRRAEEVEKMSPKSKNQSDEGATYLEKELATRVVHGYTAGRQFQHRTRTREYRTRHGYGYTPNRIFSRCKTKPAVSLIPAVSLKPAGFNVKTVY